MSSVCAANSPPRTASADFHGAPPSPLAAAGDAAASMLATTTMRTARPRRRADEMARRRP
jgi:hypothetical protein